MNDTKIDWCDMSWNPVTGCLHGCPYCYARKIAHRYGTPYSGTDLHEITGKVRSYSDAVHSGPYPFEFAPTFHRYRLGEPALRTKPRNIFVCSMADLFGAWVPDEWIREVFDACGNAPQHRYIFLTKNPAGIDNAIDYYSCEDRGCEESVEFFKDFWFGTTVTCQGDMSRAEYLSKLPEGHRILSIEPILGPVTLNLEKERCPICGSYEVYRDNPRTCQGAKPWYCDNCGEWESADGADLKPGIEWVIIGAESGNRKEKVIPQRSWIESIVSDCQSEGVPVFMKSSLTEIWGDQLIQEFPWEAEP